MPRGESSPEALASMDRSMERGRVQLEVDQLLKKYEAASAELAKTVANKETVDGVIEWQTLEDRSQAGEELTAEEEKRKNELFLGPAQTLWAREGELKKLEEQLQVQKDKLDAVNDADRLAELSRKLEGTDELMEGLPPELKGFFERKAA